MREGEKETARSRVWNFRERFIREVRFQSAEDLFLRETDRDDEVHLTADPFSSENANYESTNDCDSKRNVDVGQCRVNNDI